MTTFTIDKIRLEKLLDKIVAGGIQLPEFQRGWIWDDDHIKNLLASVSRNYPIGTIMMLETGNKELNFAARPITGVKTENKDPDELILMVSKDSRHFFNRCIQISLPIPRNQCPQKAGNE